MQCWTLVVLFQALTLGDLAHTAAWESTSDPTDSYARRIRTPRPWWHRWADPWWYPWGMLDRFTDLDELTGLVSSWSDAELREHFEELEHRWGWLPSFWCAHDACLKEMARRGGEHWRTYLVEVFEHRRKPKRHHGYLRGSADLEVFTALRRLEGKDDPIEVVVTKAGPMEFVFPELPVFRVGLRNRDPSGQSFIMQKGGNYRTGRLTRWRVEVRDENGDPIGVHREWGPGYQFGGGAASHEIFPTGETWRCADLPLRNYLDLPGLGTYTVTIQYHDQARIVDVVDATPLIVSSSDEVSFAWVAREVSITPEEAARMRGLLEKLYEKEPILFFRSPYDARMSPWGRTMPSVAEEIYLEGWKMLPILFDALQEDQDLHHRAWLLAMLESMTGLNTHGRRYRAFGEYRSIEGPRPPGGHFGRPDWGGRGSDGGLTREGQAQLIADWERYRGLIRVIE